ncbi:hypothetical protein [Laribacter hongkongensis]|uniref:hypothetical protein n=1 Tax=Laribacter hongkongensis TaxID=168471 RepID=UPI0018786AA2|nr:hypothetical protein [Laribacter hongkongensis]
MRVITIARNPRHPSNYDVKGPGKGHYDVSYQARNAGEAAAKALDWALAQSTSYVIIGSDEVLEHIPPSMRCGTRKSVGDIE